MNCFLLVILLLLVPGCMRKHKSPLQSQVVKKDLKYEFEPESAYIISKKPEADFFDDELDSFILLDDFDEEGSFKNQKNPGSIYENILLDEEDVLLVDDRDDLYNFKTAYYDYDDDSIRADQKGVFEHNENIIQKAIKDGKKVVFEGHADSAAGTSAYNLTLSYKRAQNAAKYYIERIEISPESIEVVGRGSEMPIVPCGDRNAQAPNRRVEIYTINNK